ncbi:conserved exported protein of unknown function [Rhodovastum atsumiense]|uniref:Spy/CpxP family protein refolding chaperone n=1 Tax=Rhodovastum atsumiense TaxID=504468 RepID=A0A5M6ISH7_9PROT|nr:hypothetical protein [Rhodovastum atsumiense]KAA5610518.1 hypothetical protein F1189_18710 [Rhodovastum atsumiense]CAH2605040.1 conserved exported protein of unknown function [Rhodovastum atsumiense]
MSGWLRSFVTVAAVLAATGATPAAPPRTQDPDWPCQQIKVPEMSLAAMWAGPSPAPEAAGWQADATVAETVRRLAERRLPLDQAKADIQDFALRAGAQRRQQLLSLLVGLFEVMNQQRDSVLSGLERFGRRQKALAVELREAVEKLHGSPAGPAGEAGAIDPLRQQVEWQARVFDQRRQMLASVCDVPGRIEQRLFALTRLLQDALDHPATEAAPSGKMP